MDIATLVGLVTGAGLIAWVMFGGGEGANPGMFFSVHGLVVVLGGAIAGTTVSFPLRDVLRLPTVIKNCFLHKQESPQKLIQDLVSYAEIARRDGILSLENVVRSIKDEFLVKGIQMAIDGTDPEIIEDVLKSDLTATASRHATGKGMLDAMAMYGPSFGMIATLIGLVMMLKSMDDPSKIGPAMAVALLGTLYGALLANLVCGPMATKLAKRSHDELVTKEIIIRGVISIQSGDNPRVVEQKLKTFLEPKMRGSAEAALQA
jgi:chemotaxis protein MotA